MKITLIGYMASGKSTLAQELAHKLDLPFLDLDIEVEKKCGLNVNELILQKGELAFRKIERQVLQEIMNLPKFVLATGGGTPCYYNNIEVLNLNSTTIYLDVTIKELVNRLNRQENKRALLAHLKDGEHLEFVAKHLFERRHFYNQSQITLRGDSLTLNHLLEKIQ